MTGGKWLQPVWSQKPIQEVESKEGFSASCCKAVNPQLTSAQFTNPTLELAQAHQESHAEETYLDYLNGILTMHQQLAMAFLAMQTLINLLLTLF